MKKNYEVLLTAYCSVVVIGAKDEEEAIEFALDEVSRGDFEIEETNVEREIENGPQLESAKRHAEVVTEP